MKKTFIYLLFIIGLLSATQAQNNESDSIPNYLITINKKNGEKFHDTYSKGHYQTMTYPFNFINEEDTFYLYNYNFKFKLDSIENIEIELAGYDFIQKKEPVKILPETYLNEPDQNNVEKAINTFNTFNTLEGQYNIRGGKEGGMPGAHAYQRQYSMGPDCYAQYFTVPHNDFMYGSLTSTYNISPDYNMKPLEAYRMARNNFMPILHNPEIDYIPEMKAILLLYYSVIAQEHADLAGPFSYTQDKCNNYDNELDDLKTIYYGIVEDLEDIVACLKNFETRPDWYKQKISALMMYRLQTIHMNEMGNPDVMNSYIKLANSLKLRMAMHIVKVDAVTAKRWAEEAVAGGVVESEYDQQGIWPLYGFTHPLAGINGWGDLRMSASFESLLMSLDHPYTKYLFLPNSQPITNVNTGEVLEANSRICGIRSGTLVGTGQTYALNQRQGYSIFDNAVMNSTLPPCYFLKWAEVDFLRAEGALRGWNMGGDAQFFYERGIKNAYLEDPMMVESSPYKSLVDEYMSLAEPVEYVQVDPMGDGADWPSVTKIGVKWNDNDDLETKLEKIITQKYIALFPLSTEAWAEMRRTGYPKMFSVLNTGDGDGSIPQGKEGQWDPNGMIRRIPWKHLPFEYDKTYMKYFSIPILGGPDEQATRLWWDVDAPNF